MVVKIIIVLFLIIILYSLGSALVHLVRHKGRQDENEVVKALTWRIGLSLLLFFLLFLAFFFGLIKPHGV